jgi:hypothetical protein
MNRSSLGALFNPKVGTRLIAEEAPRPRLPEPSGPPKVPPEHPMAGFYRCGPWPAQHMGLPARDPDEEKVKEAVVSTLALLDMAITAASMAGAGADDFESGVARLQTGTGRQRRKWGCRNRNARLHPPD